MSASFAARAALAVFVVCSHANAAEPASKPAVSDSVAAQPRERARVRYRQGVEAFKESRFRDAIDLFLEADQLAPSAALSFNIAAAYEKIDEPASVLRWYRDYVRRAPDAPDRRQVEETISRLEHTLEQRGVQQLTVSSTPTGATLSVDGHSVGVTPWTGEIPPGAHKLELTLDGYSTASRSIDLPSDHATDVAMELSPEVARPQPSDATPPLSSLAQHPAREQPAPRASHSGLTTAGWISVAAGGAAMGGALVFEVLRRGADSDAEKDRTQVGYADKLDTMYGRQTAARVLLGVGGALAVTGGVLLWLGREPAQAGQTAVAISCGPGGCASSVHGKF